MKLLLGAVAYLSVVAAVVLAAFAGVASIERRPPAQSPPILASSADDAAARRARAPEEAPANPTRVPVWIAPTAKYQYTPVPIEPRRIPPAISRDALRAMAKDVKPRTKAPAAGTEASARAGADLPRAPGFGSRRDNDPFFRD